MYDYTIVLKVVKGCYNIGYNDFCDVVYEGERNGYTREKFEKMQNNFILWFCDLDNNNQKKVVEYFNEKHY